MQKIHVLITQFIAVGFLLIALSNPAWASWPHTWGGGSDDRAGSVAHDGQGNLYVAGATSSFGAGASDVLIVKYSSAGQVLWSKTWGGGGDEDATAVAIGPDGYIYVTGRTSSFGAGWFDFFFLKLDTSGNLQPGSTTWGGGSYDVGHDIGFDSAGNIYVVGETYSFGPCCSSSVLMKFSPSGGAPIWTTSWKGPATYDAGYSLTVDSNFNVIVAGISWDYSVFPLHNSLLLIKYDANGNHVWSKNYSTPFPGQDESWNFRALTTDSAGNIYVGGRHANQCQTFDFSQCNLDTLVLKVNSSGNFQWANTWGGSGYDTAGSIALDPSGHLLVSGIEDVFGTPMLFVLSYDTVSGNLLSQSGRNQGTVSPGINVAGMVLDNTGNAFVVAAAQNNSGAWAGTSATTGTLPNSVVASPYSLGAPVAPTFGLNTITVLQTGVEDTGGGGSDVFISNVSPVGPTAPPAWIKLSTTGEPPAPKSGAIISVYDPSSNRLILFGGNTIAPCCTAYNDVWVLTNANGLGGTAQWIKLNPTGPSGFPAPRGHHSAVYDSANNRMIIFGGGQWNEISPGFFIFVPRFNDVWVLTNANGVGGTPQWIPLSPAAGPPAPRETARAVYDPATNRMIIFGGGNNGINDVPNDVWVLTNANGLGGTSAWIQLPPIGQIPPALQSHAATFDPITNRMTIFAGSTPSFTNDTYVLTNANGLGGLPIWIHLSPAGTLPAVRGTLTYGYDPIQNRLVIFGVGNSSGYLNDTWILTNANGLGSTPTWINTIPNGASCSPPAAVTTSGGTYDAADNRLILIRNGPDVPAAVGLEVWVLTNASGTTPAAPCTAPPTVNAGGPYSTPEGGSVTVSASGSDPNGDSLTYAWDLDNNGSFETSGQSVSFSASLLDGPSSYTVKVRATDLGGLSAESSATVNVTNVAPTVSASFGASSVSCGANNATLNVNFTDPATADTQTALISWGDGNTQTVNPANSPFSRSHTYAAAGSYTATVTVTDDDGGVGTTTTSVAVKFNTSGFLQPINADGTSVFKYNSTIPVKISFTNCNGSVPNNLAPTIRLTMISGATPGLEINEPISTSAADTTGVMRFSTNQYIYNLATKPLPDSSATYLITVTVPSTGQTATVQFGLRP